jgi:hypothetical protein
MDLTMEPDLLQNYPNITVHHLGTMAAGLENN